VGLRCITHELVSAHGAWLASVGAPVVIVVAIGALVVIILVALVPREHRVEAIRAAAELLAALLPWPGRRRGRSPDR
jgi:hypothetical protein